MKMNILIILSIMLCGASCEKLVDHVYSIKIQNNTNDTLLFYESYNYPDSSIVQNKPILTRVYPKDYSYLDSKKDWDEVLVSPKDTISIFILSKGTVDKYSWEAIRADYKILKRYDLSIQDLENNQWTITYP
ncbi:MAG TPA: hypothetical protein PLA42_07660 [Tenuifilaceae bacterium]|nr:hypothetical protein [Tenuifilaceae bacterium]HOA09652.1 hypothetical protein [Tenuifilaceae bacterium]HOG72739.1 hypothetical protein [Tenuifilaceae bacterium]HPA67984.1 hypothetical protein [Tenuifilaceae bacterium]HPH00556.1 hypothetical protein [Tenuifilaceae bacterium]